MNSPIIPKPPWTRLGKKLESMLRKAVYDYQLLDKVDHIAIALSGGKDSLTLLFLLKALSGFGFAPFKITALHVKGEYSCGSSVHESYLKGLCHQIEVPFYSLEQIQNPETLNCYSCSRKRRSLLFNKAKELDIHHIAFGHHRDDSNETLLLNLLHKGEFVANLPKVYMEKFEITVIRPLILISEEDIISFSQQYGFARVMCKCPVGQNSKRKQVAQLIKQLETAFPHTRANLALAAKIYGSDKANRL